MKFNKLDIFNPHFVGVDKLAQSLQDQISWVANNVHTYPPFNLRKVDDSKYLIEMAVAGFTSQEIEITLDNNKLIVKGNTKTDDKPTYLYEGIANRAFTRRFTLADNVEINNAELVNGMLKLWLDHIIPEDKKPRKINIEETKK